MAQELKSKLWLSMKARLKHYTYTPIHGAIDGQVCFYRRSFSHPAKPRRSTTGCMGPVGGTNKATWCVRLLPTTVSAYHVDCGCFCALLGTHCCCLSPCGWYNPPSAPHPPPPPTPPTHPPPINSIRDITAVGKNCLKIQQYQLGGRISYKTIAT